MKAVRFEKPKGFEGIDGLVYEDAPDAPARDRRRTRAGARRQLHPDRAAVAALDRSRRTRPGAADPGPRGVGHRGRARLRLRRRVGRATRCSASSTGTATAGPPTTWPSRFAAWRRSRRRSTSSKPPRSRRPRSRRGRRCSTTAISSPARPWSSTAPAAGSGRWRCRSPAGPAPTSSEPVAADARQRVLDLGADEFVDVEQDGWENDDRPGRPGLRHHRRRRARSFGRDRQARWSARLDHGSAANRSERHPHRGLRSGRERCAAPRDRSTRRRGDVRPEVERGYPLADAREAFMAKSTRAHSGQGRADGLTVSVREPLRRAAVGHWPR